MDVLVFLREVESCVRQLGVEEEEAALREAAPTTPRAEPQMEAFRGILELYALTDLGFAGVLHTYDNKRVSATESRFV